eukprot:1139658-Pelagomonas_calceolata.AAC.1
MGDKVMNILLTFEEAMDIHGNLIELSAFYLLRGCRRANLMISSSATVMLRNPGQAQGGRQQGGGPRIEPLWPGWR